MIMFLVLAGIVLAAVAVTGRMFFVFKQEALLEQEKSAAPVRSLSSLMPAGAGEAVAVGSGAGLPPPFLPAVDQEAVRLLKEEIASVQNKAAEEARHAIDAMADLRQENDLLREEKARQEQARLEHEAELSGHLKAENAAFKEQVDASRQELSRVMAEAEAMRSELETRLTRVQESAVQQGQERMDSLRQEIELLRRDNEALKASQAVQSENISAHSFLNAEAVEALKEDLETMRQGRAALEARVEELEGVIHASGEQGKFLQYELVKSRAQVSGMERACENARHQFEGVARHSRGAEQGDGVVLTGSSDRGPTDFGRLNAELIKRERLVRFETEQSRSAHR